MLLLLKYLLTELRAADPGGPEARQNNANQGNAPTRNRFHRFLPGNAASAGENTNLATMFLPPRHSEKNNLFLCGMRQTAVY